MTTLRSMTIALVLAAAGCSPVYETRYHLVPPETQPGKLCLAQCEGNKTRCEELEQDKNDTCKSTANPEEREKCTLSVERCQQSYYRCYRVCGGKVEEERVCLENC